nr:hypothetical protein CFP56_37434 [Quercus suber]
MDDSSKKDGVEKEVAFLAKNFRKFLKMKNSGKPFNRGKFSSSRGDRKEFKRKEGKDSQSSSDIMCYECNGHGHLKKECLNFLRGKGKAYTTTLSDSDSSGFDSEESCDEEGNYSAFMTIAHVDSSNDLGALVKELGVHSDLESVGIVEESEDEVDGEEMGLQETYNSLLEKTGGYAKVANASTKKMKRVEEDYKSLMVRFLEQEVVQAHAKIERVSSQKLDDVISSQKPSSDKSGLGYTEGSSSSAKVTKEVKFVKTKDTVEEPTPEKVTAEKKKNVADQQVIARTYQTQLSKAEIRQQSSAPRSQGRRNDMSSWGGEQPRSQNRDPGMMDVMKMISAFTNCLESFTRRFESPNSRTQSVKDITPNTCDVWVKKGTHA